MLPQKATSKDMVTPSFWPQRENTYSETLRKTLPPISSCEARALARLGWEGDESRQKLSKKIT